MTEYPELTPYEYHAFPLPMLAVGWLGKAHGIPGPPLDAAELTRLKAASWMLSQVMLGVQPCDFCPGGDDRFDGSGEYHYYAPGGETYAAPAMIVHYAEAHGYRPPAVVMDALAPPGSLAWDARAQYFVDLLADPAADAEDRAAVVPDLANWLDDRVLTALLGALAEPSVANLVDSDIGGVLGLFIARGLAPGLRVEELSVGAREGIDWALQRSAG